MDKDLKLQQKIDFALKSIWQDNIISDYNNHYLLKEDSLKSSVYHHLRTELGDGYLNRNRIRIFTEYYMGTVNGKKQIADIAVVKLKAKNSMLDDYYIKDRVESILAIIELKFKHSDEGIIKKDIIKFKDYSKHNHCTYCQFYLAVIYERVYSKSIGSWLHKNQKDNWAKNRVTELTAHFDEENEAFVSNIISHRSTDSHSNRVVEGNMLPNRIMGKCLTSRVIPTVCNLELMLHKLKNVGGDYTRLRPWEQRSYKAYNIEVIKSELLKVAKEEWSQMVKEHILTGDKSKFGANCVDIYLVGYVASQHGVGKRIFFQYVYDNEITTKENSANAIWQVGKRDGEYLGILGEDGSFIDPEFLNEWIRR